MEDKKSRIKTNNSQITSELEKAKDQFDAFDKNIKDLTMDRMNAAPKQDVEPQTQLSQRQIDKSKDIYLKPERAIMDKAKFNENYREQWNYAKEYVQFTAENREIIGESIEMWTHPFAGVSYEYWKVPVNKPVWGPRYVAENLKKCSYHRLVMKETLTENVGYGQMYGQMAADTTIQRLDAHPVSQKRSVFMGASNF